MLFISIEYSVELELYGSKSTSNETQTQVQQIILTIIK